MINLEHARRVHDDDADYPISRIMIPEHIIAEEMGLCHARVGTEVMTRAYTADSDDPDAENRWVTVYTITRHYGGPEEGGWYWNRAVAEATIMVAGPKDRENCIAACKKRFEGLAYGDIYSVRGGRRVDVVAERHPGDHEQLKSGGYQ